MQTRLQLLKNYFTGATYLMYFLQALTAFLSLVVASKLFVSKKRKKTNSTKENLRHDVMLLPKRIQTKYKCRCGCEVGMFDDKSLTD